jgi:excisionase family DNA binding protein
MVTPTIITPEHVKTFLAGKRTKEQTLPSLVTARQLAAATQIAESAIYEWVHMEYIPHVRLCRCVRFNLVEVQAWLQQHAKPGAKRAQNHRGGEMKPS